MLPSPSLYFFFASFSSISSLVIRLVSPPAQSTRTEQFNSYHRRRPSTQQLLNCIVVCTMSMSPLCLPSSRPGALSEKLLSPLDSNQWTRSLYPPHMLPNNQTNTIGIMGFAWIPSYRYKLHSITPIQSNPNPPTTPSSMTMVIITIRFPGDCKL